MGDIKRINSYSDERFDHEVLKQHGAFIVDDKFKCQFLIKDARTAEIRCDREEDIDLAVEEFRFYSENITKFLDCAGELVREFDDVELLKISPDVIQPSQFYVSKQKVEALSDYMNRSEDIIIPVAKMGNKYISLDGHTRLHIAVDKGLSKVSVYITKAGDYIQGFVDQAINRGILSPKELEVLSAEEYVLKWDKFCEDYFERLSKD